MRGPYRQVQGENDDISYWPDHNSALDGNLDVDSKSPRRPSNYYTEGWRFGAINCAISASIAFLINIIATIWASTLKDQQDGVMRQGDCDSIHKVNSGLHLLINLLGTILLSSSNYCMQCLSAPTRREIDLAHRNAKWLDIGVPSVRNLRFISRKRACLWFALGLSSLPLHLFYNSVVFASISSNDYYAFSVSQSFVDNAECQNCSYAFYHKDDREAVENSSTTRYELQSAFQHAKLFERLLETLHAKARNGTLDRLEPSACINAYAQMIQNSRSNVLLVASNDEFPPSSNHTYFSGTDAYYYTTFTAEDAQSVDYAADAYYWMCRDTYLYTDPCPNCYSGKSRNPCASVIDYVRKEPRNWTVGGYPVEYCLSDKAPPVCKLQFSLGIAILVIVLNFCKALIILYTVFGVEDDPLMTMGDAVASFLENPDSTTRNMCLLTMKQAKTYNWCRPALSQEWDPTVHRWKDATSKTRRTTTFAMYVLALILVGILLGMGVSALVDGRSLPDLVRLGYGVVDPRAVISWNITSITSNIIMANLPQPILSFLYFSFNGLFTCMLLSVEWNKFGHERKGLRVSHAPRGAQRSTYFLQLPYRFALPLMLLSGVLHWLVSQSIFLVAIDLYSDDGLPNLLATEPGGWLTCGYSPIAIISVLILGIFMVLAGFALGYLKYKPGIPLAGSCSAAISAACHSIEWDGVEGRKIAISKLQWGVVGTGLDGIGHCAFSSKEVKQPETGVFYAGTISSGQGGQRRD
ncbi:hypothetical protein BCR34DRAFT_483765 [Clohesyomyces aquaticus]|uniref:DUF6536 domain-containing protein n=1 Tax=Clohesyomyces aquaticus TaxID=1231657 RepID=A0A1Y1ZNC5_9PLEO|nr:hypothetical protein BCR34DRAFT_483765 [Clohesyomyces aquaticus]